MHAVARSEHDRACVRELLIEEFIHGAEFSCGVLFDRALPVIEIVPQDTFYSYEAKYAEGGSRHFVPARIDDSLARRLQSLALSVHQVVGLRDYSRTDFIVDEKGKPYILETNALPGLTPTSLVPEECAAAGISYDALIERLITDAFVRSNRLRA
jgi:D-alanine-D-alanine ligase